METYWLVGRVRDNEILVQQASKNPQCGTAVPLLDSSKLLFVAEVHFVQRSMRGHGWEKK